MNETNQDQSSVKNNSLTSSNYDIEIAEHVWLKVRGYPIPDCFSEKDKLEIFDRYYHRAVAQSQGE